MPALVLIKKSLSKPLWLRQVMGQPLKESSFCTVCITLGLCGDLVGPFRVGDLEEHWPFCCFGLWLDSMTLRVFSNLNDSMVA